MTLLRLFLSFTLWCFPYQALAILDREMAESLKCSRLFSYFERKHRIPLDTLHSISLQESGKTHSKHNIKIVWPWTVNVEGQGYFFDNKREAVLFVKQQLLTGKTSIDIGCMQINLKHHPDAFKSIEHAFDPVSNITYGAEFLKRKYDQLGNWLQAIAHYHSATHELGSKYKESVVKIANNMNEYKYSLKAYSYPHYYNRHSQPVSKTSYQKFVTKPEKTYVSTPNKAKAVTLNNSKGDRIRKPGVLYVSARNSPSTKPVYKSSAEIELQKRVTAKNNATYRKISLNNKNRSNMMVRVPPRQPVAQ
ncbi:Lytic transglycosylase domain-containing protein [Candidatus Trichorickettsia mobilis]|uniref:Lytic transglycosylase domain-containing protein n=1 Tax=Candidatus Trichorickettsia mobilis TaxID=1346319 RepID=A0ABZ0UUV6_9RICK|nr:Lytic transglycosylase domain-containing protein [Candidatus Trichorickettsia mobilis]